MSRSKKELHTELRKLIGTDVYPLVKSITIDTLTEDQLIEELTERQIVVEYPIDRRLCENLLRNAVKGDEVLLVEVVKIDTLTVSQLEEAFKEVAKSRKTIREIQQEMAENCGYGDYIVWDQLSKEDNTIIKSKIKLLIPDWENDQKDIDKKREKFVESLWAQRKYTNGNTLTQGTLIEEDTDFNTAPDSIKYTCHPVFRCRKCVANCSSRKCCMVYVDETGRVYQNWKSFVEDNVLPAGTMVSPRRGIYNFDKNGNVILDVYCTPNATTGAKIMNVAKTSSTVLGVGAACVLALPVAAPVMATAGLVGLGAGAFSAITSAFNLSNRKKHEQSISVTDREAMSSYFGIVGGVFGMAATGAKHVVHSVAGVAGKTGVGLFVNGGNKISNILDYVCKRNANGVLDIIFKYKDEDTISTMDVQQLSESLVLFTHSVHNLELALQLESKARINSIKDYKETLRNRQRRVFDKMSIEARRIGGDTEEKHDIIRNINKIPDRQYLKDLFNKSTPETNVTSADPKYDEDVLNSEVPIDSTAATRVANNNHPTVEQSPARLLFNRPIDLLNLDEILNDKEIAVSPLKTMEILKSLSILFPSGEIIKLIQFGEAFLTQITDGEKFRNILETMASTFPEEVVIFLLELTQYFIEETMCNMFRLLHFYISTETIIFNILEYLQTDLENITYEYMVMKRQEILEHLSEYYLSLSSNNLQPNSTKCSECDGWYYVCQL
ncbi:uncharacterized protein isoform X2 [Musca autumnalis]|uniref:uncharacterized protein isoform X2 n=2 Tax=Musca autumnalis TaxID=221902 RepID=UPI003CF9A7D8